MSRLNSLALLALLMPCTLWAQDDFQSGLWRVDMTTFNLPRAEDDAPVSSATDTLCLTPEQAQSPQGVVQALWGQVSCNDVEIGYRDGGAKVSVACGEGDSAMRSVDTLTFDSPTAFISELKTDSHGYTAQTLSEYRWLASDC
ncbi:DUF3617 family protein [Halomonas sp. PAMB 3232]|uniref:DUF3617 domain-containing protein n=1 Tax=Halomonas sp. PAMB 3232 TaxID=3075221 RepID=UPI00289D0D9C|nr:DUF3617 family protein [Halomonas sp. PAMB 3232]WNL38011.1 DUF3617 family protein [Halomonas sp. PAMB 3232]